MHSNDRAFFPGFPILSISFPGVFGDRIGESEWRAYQIGAVYLPVVWFVGPVRGCCHVDLLIFIVLMR